MRPPSMPHALSGLWRTLVVSGFSRTVSIAAFAVVGASCATARPAAPAVTPSGVRFVLIHPGARSVALAGSFNQWSASSDLLTRDPRGGAWTIVVTLPPGEHLFMYVVDGSQWISPPLAADYMDDGFGAKNGVVVVPPIEQ
jgi:1,4-alpha-glucan branching enzyme